MIYVIIDGNFFLPTLGSGVPWHHHTMGLKRSNRRIGKEEITHSFGHSLRSAPFHSALLFSTPLRCALLRTRACSWVGKWQCTNEITCVDMTQIQPIVQWTVGPTDRRTDGPTDTPSYRDAMTCIKKAKWKWAPFVPSFRLSRVVSSRRTMGWIVSYRRMWSR